MLDNLQMAQPNGDMGDGDEMQQALDELGDMIRQQQQLRDRTFRQGQDQRRQQRQQGQRGQQGDRNQMGELRQDQQALREQLNKLLEEMKRRASRSRAKVSKATRARAIRSAAPARRWATHKARSARAMPTARSNRRGRALEAMRKGAQGMAQSMQQQMGQGPGPGNPGRTGQARANQDTDPLGRPLRGRDYGDDTTVKVPGEIDVQRRRRILEELRKRFGESFRPQLELDYIERLLKDY
jgi:septal ring factor EnvC (AmiA/AmiB activator)